MNESCKTCYYMREALIETRDEWGKRNGGTEKRPQCRRNAPQPDASAFWPWVSESDWCGEWKWHLEDTDNAS